MRASTCRGDPRHHFTDDRHPGGRRILSKSTDETSAAKAHEVAKPVIDVTEAEYIRLIEVCDFAARELVDVSARAWHERLATTDWTARRSTSTA